MDEEELSPEILARILEEYPNALNLDWVEVTDQDPAILGRILRNMSILENTDPRRRGIRWASNEQIEEDLTNIGILPLNEL